MLLDGWRLAAGMLTAVPVRAPAALDRTRAGTAMGIAPLAVLPLGCACALVAWGGVQLGLPLLVVALLAISVVVLGNRAFHLDGLSDTSDALAASYDRERSLEVMKSGTSGPAGTTATILVLGLQIAGLAGVLAGEYVLRSAVLAGVAVCASRAAFALCCVRGVAAARPSGLGHMCAGSVPRSAVVLVWVVVAASLAAAGRWSGLPWWRGLLSATVAAAVVMLLLRRASRRLGGVTGDIFGAGAELSLAAILVVFS
jgi:adenosylcobinamide-GDP ribazoletransferase